jgi:hypothetical protein
MDADHNLWPSIYHIITTVCITNLVTLYLLYEPTNV